MITPGKYLVTISSSGKMTWVPIHQTLRDLWIGEGYELFTAELERHGYTVGNRLLMDGPTVKALIQWMYQNGKVKTSKTEIFEALKNTFELSFHNVRSLQGEVTNEFAFRNEFKSFPDRSMNPTFIKNSTNGKEDNTR